MASYFYSQLTFPATIPGGTAIFKTSDKLIFDDSTISASELIFDTTTANLKITIGSNVITLTGFAQAQMAAANFIFADGSALIIGDNTTATTKDGSANLLSSTDGDDYLDGLGGSDTVVYSNASSAVTINLATTTAQDTGGAGSDLLKNIENIRGSIYNDTLTGDDNDNVLDGGFGIDALTGGAGNDTYIVTAGDTVTESAGVGGGDSDTVQSKVDYTLGANIENLTLLTGAQYGTGNSGSNTITGNAAANVLEGGGGTDTLKGLGGNDTYIVRTGTVTITEAANGGTDTVQAFMTTTLDVNVENLRLMGKTAINGIGNDGNNIIYANSALNTLDGKGGTDTLSYQFGASSGVVAVLSASAATTVSGGSGADVISNFENLIGSRFNDNFTGSTANNILAGGLGNDTLTGAGGNDTLDGGVGNDTYVVDKSNTDDAKYIIIDAGGIDAVETNVSFSIELGYNSIENLTSTSSSDITLIGNNNANILTSGAGEDTLQGRNGNDTYVINSTTDTVTELAGQGTDTVKISVTGYTLVANVENLILTGTAVAGTGNALANTITGNDANNNLNGGAGKDIMIGGNGGDTYTVDDTGDKIVEKVDEGSDSVQSSATFTLSANVENLTLTGTGNINATGNGEANTLIGNDGNNIITAGAGLDVITAGKGADSIILGESVSAIDKVVQADGDSKAATANNIVTTIKVGDTITFANGLDIITGFKAGTDVLDVGTAGTAVSGIGLDETNFTATKTIFLSGSYSASTKVFTVTADGSGSSTLLLDTTVAADRTIATADTWILLVGVDSDSLVSGTFV